MAKIKLYIAKAQNNNSGAAKGTGENPYTEAEYEEMLNNGTWSGGYPKMSNRIHKITFMLLCSLASFILSCKQSARDEILTEQQIELKRKRLIAGERLQKMLHDKDYEQVLQYLDTLYLDYPRDPQLFFLEGWAYDMLGYSLLAHIAYAKSVDVYDSLIAAKSDVGDMINRAVVIQLLYGQEEYSHALDEILQSNCSYEDSLFIEGMGEIKGMRETMYKDILEF